MELHTVVHRLHKFAPTTLAGSWDNVGLLLEPTMPHTVNKTLLTNDLTEAVMDEALEMHADLIISYHPPIFSPLKRVTQKTWKERIIVKCLENRVALYSPHTTYDAVKGGVNDWLIQPFDGSVEPIETVTSPCYLTPGGFFVEFSVNHQNELPIMQELTNISGVSMLERNSGSNGTDKVHMNCTQRALSRVVQIINDHEMLRSTMNIMQLSKPPVPGQGPGRVVKLHKPTTIEAAIDRVKQHLKMEHISLALASTANMDSEVKTVAVCAGSGSSVLKGVKADLWISGEMSHHDLLDANHNSSSVILCNHSNTERGYLLVLKDILSGIYDNKIEVTMSKVDKDPLLIV